MNLPPLIIQEHAGFQVVRGDLYPGGIKCRVLTELLDEEIREGTVTYFGCYYGHSAFALGLAGLHTGKRVYLCLQAPEKDTYIYRMLRSLTNVHFDISSGIGDYTPPGIARLAQKCGLSPVKVLPVGFDCASFTSRYVRMIRSLKVDPDEVWVTGGSGVSARCLSEAWPEAKINVVHLGVREYPNFGNPHKVWTIPEKLCEEALDPPPWPSARYYDAKMWQVVREHAKPGALIWNIA